MRIAVDGEALIRRRKTGVDYYARGLLQAAIAQLPEVEFELWYGGPRHDAGLAGPNVKIRRLPLPAKLSQKLAMSAYGFLIPWLLSWTGRKPDVFLAPNFVFLPGLRAQRKIAVIHDLTFEFYPQYMTPKIRRFLHVFTVRTARQADAIIVNSANTKNDVAKQYQIDPTKITVAGPAVDHQRFRPGGRPNPSYGIDGPYILFTGSLEPRKNVGGLLAAYEQLDPSLQKQFALVLAGGKGWLNEAIMATIERLRQQGLQIITTGYVDENDLPDLYAGASLFAYPSFYEGFGMPVLEAMSCGVPVVTSRGGALAEVAGEAAVLVDPNDTADLARAISKILTDQDEAKRLAAAGVKRAQEFSWTRSGAKLAAVIRNLKAN